MSQLTFYIIYNKVCTADMSVLIDLISIFHIYISQVTTTSVVENELAIRNFVWRGFCSTTSLQCTGVKGSLPGERRLKNLSPGKYLSPEHGER
jgi:hypothetical protein